MTCWAGRWVVLYFYTGPWVVEQRFMHFCLSFYLCLAFALPNGHWTIRSVITVITDERRRRGCSGGGWRKEEGTLQFSFRFDF